MLALFAGIVCGFVGGLIIDFCRDVLDENQRMQAYMPRPEELEEPEEPPKKT